MPLTVKKLPQEPIIVVNCFEHITVEDYMGMYKQIQTLCEGMSGPIFRITDVREADVADLTNLLKMVQNAAKGTSGSPTDPRFHVIYIGGPPLAKLGLNIFSQSQHGGMDIPLMPSMEDALAYARSEIKKAAGAS